MIEYLDKDITTVGMGIVAHGVNCQGKMASGVAKAIREKWPVVYEKYMANPKGKAMLGTCHIIDVSEQDSLFVANCYTQVYYGYGGGKYADTDAIERCMNQLCMYADVYDIPIFMPRIGCGLGGLDWDKDVLPGVERANKTWKRVTTFVCDILRMCSACGLVPVEEGTDECGRCLLSQGIT